MVWYNISKYLWNEITENILCKLVWCGENVPFKGAVERWRELAFKLALKYFKALSVGWTPGSGSGHNLKASRLAAKAGSPQSLSLGQGREQEKSLKSDHVWFPRFSLASQAWGWDGPSFLHVRTDFLNSHRRYRYTYLLLTHITELSLRRFQLFTSLPRKGGIRKIILTFFA